MKRYIFLFWLAITLVFIQNVNATEIDLTKILKDKEIDKQLSREAPGNEGYANLESAKLDLATGLFKSKINMVYRHVNFRAFGKPFGPPEISFNVWVDGHIESGTDGKCILKVDRAETSNDLLKALGAVSNILINIFTLGRENIGSVLRGSSDFDCNF